MDPKIATLEIADTTATSLAPATTSDTLTQVTYGKFTGEIAGVRLWNTALNSNRKKRSTEAMLDSALLLTTEDFPGATLTEDTELPLTG